MANRIVEYWRRLTSPLESAQGALQEQRWEEAVRHYERLRRQDPEDWRGYGEACVAYRHLNQWDRADAVVEEGLARLGERRELLIAYGDIAMDCQRWEEALARWARLCEVCPDEEKGWVRSIEALIALERIPQARQKLAEAVQTLGERDGLAQAGNTIEGHLKALLDAAQGALQEQRWEEAVRHYERLRRQDPEDWRGYGEACVAYRHLNQWDRADAVVEEGLARLGERRELLITYGDTAMDCQRWEEALARWARLCAACPDEEKGWVRSIEALIALERIPQARQKLAEAVQTLGERDGLAQAGNTIEGHLKALLDEAQGALQEQRWEEAVRHYERLRRQDPEDWRGYGEACVAYRHLNQWDRADAVVEEGLARLGERRELLIAYGDTAMDSQRWEEALRRWGRLKREYPEDRYSHRRAIQAVENINELLSRIRAFELYRRHFGWDEPDSLSLSLLETLSNKMKKKRRICFIQGAGFLGHSKYLFLYLNRYKKDFGLEVFWVTVNYREYELLNSKALPVFYFDGSPASLDFLLKTDVAIYETHDPIKFTGGLRQAALSGAVKVQLWHGVPAKVVGYASFLQWKNTRDFICYASDACVYDYVITESAHVFESYQMAFPYSRLIPLGGCRTDVLLGSPLFEEEEIWLGGEPSQFSLSYKKLILYAPTYRERIQKIEPFLTALQDFVNCIKRLDNFILAIKPHPAFITECGVDFVKLIEATENIIVLAGGEDVYPWAARADYLVTDYSSIYYDFLITKKPIVFFRPDLDLYEKTRTRIVYSFESGIEPGPVVTTALEIPGALRESENEKWRTNREALSGKFHALPHDGMVTKRVADFIVSLLRV